MFIARPPAGTGTPRIHARRGAGSGRSRGQNADIDSGPGVSAMFQPDLEAMLPTERAALQLVRFVGLVRRLKKSESPYWQEKLREVDPDGLHGIEDITRLPFTVKSERPALFPFATLFLSRPRRAPADA